MTYFGGKSSQFKTLVPLLPDRGFFRSDETEDTVYKVSDRGRGCAQSALLQIARLMAIRLLPLRPSHFAFRKNRRG